MSGSEKRTLGKDFPLGKLGCLSSAWAMMSDFSVPRRNVDMLAHPGQVDSAPQRLQLAAVPLDSMALASH